MKLFHKLVLGATVIALAGGCARDDADDARHATTAPAAQRETTSVSDVLSVGEARRARPRARATVEGLLFISFVPRESTRLCTSVTTFGAAPRCVRPAIPARIPSAPIEGLESTANGLFIWSPRPTRFVGSFNDGVFAIERIVP